VSPDGKRVAFGESLIDSDVWSAACLGYGSIQQDHDRVANAQTGKAIGMITPPGLANLWTPSWLPDGRVLAFAPYNTLSFQVGSANPGEELAPWFSDPKENPNELLSRRNISEGEASPDGSQIALIRGD
jgi:Tol biopolymer transport system component